MMAENPFPPIRVSNYLEDPLDAAAERVERAEEEARNAEAALHLSQPKFAEELEWQIRHRGYSEVMGDLMAIVRELDAENFVGLFPYWRMQAAGIRTLIELTDEKKGGAGA